MRGQRTVRVRSEFSLTVLSPGSARVASVFWDSSGILFINYLEKGKTINSDYYCTLLDRLKEKVTTKWPYLLKKKYIFLQDSTPAHKLIKTMAKLNELRIELIPQPLYSPDLVPSDSSVPKH